VSRQAASAGRLPAGAIACVVLLGDDAHADGPPNLLADDELAHLGYVTKVAEGEQIRGHAPSSQADATEAPPADVTSSPAAHLGRNRRMTPR
jgi:hypothetical protein